MPVIRIDDDVYGAIQEKAIPLEDSANSVLRRLLGLRRPRLKTGQRSKGEDQTPHRELWIPILQALVDLGGKGRVVDVYDRIEKRATAKLKKGDYSNVSGGEVRWRNAVRFVRLDLKKAGLLKSNSRRGYWEITENGRRYLNQALND